MTVPERSCDVTLVVDPIRSVAACDFRFENVAKERYKDREFLLPEYVDNMNTTKKRILVIDDEPTAVDMLHRILELNGYEVLDAANGIEGVELFRNNVCDLVITDMVMPKKDGLQTILDLRDDYPELPIIAISGGGTISKERYLAVAGYLDKVIAIAKPFTIETILKAVAKLLGSPVRPEAS